MEGRWATWWIVVLARRFQPQLSFLWNRAKAPPDPAIARMVTTLLALELERSRSPDWQNEEVAGVFVAVVFGRKVTDRGDIVARASELGTDLEKGAGAIVLRAAPRTAQTGEWRARVLTLAMRTLRSLAPGALAAVVEGPNSANRAIIALITRLISAIISGLSL